MTKDKIRLTALTTAFGALLGLVAAGVWAMNEPDLPGEALYVSDSEGELPGPLFPSDVPATFSGAGFWDLSPVPDDRLPVSLWVALPLATAVVGGVVGAVGSAAGVRVSRG
ncbi:hypothetical protein [Rhodococcus sp. I2R]|uniref:hypothetical protein n=1 Tax=Rhodococcus sp. I2R TaxID=2855445 RepID=UPI001E48494A|nr:hypothetical protein [Rhodococcus sp. I2R]MCC8928844.1 hypothetical protein [Rhodococcus sp. I2R]